MNAKTKERPILFSAPMVNAVLAGRKTQTRRIVKPQPRDGDIESSDRYLGEWFCWEGGERQPSFCCPYGQPSDRLWVRETWKPWERYSDMADGILYRASPDGAFRTIENSPEAAEKWVVAYDNGKHREHWRPSIFMPRWASRITLEVVTVRVERLQEITPTDAIDEGAMLQPNRPTYEQECREARERGELKPPLGDGPIPRFRRLWQSLHGPGSWEASPWVWVVSFQRVETGAGGENR